VPIKATDEARVGLILRDTPHQGRRWCLVGGRIRIDESVEAAARRHLAETFGEAVSKSARIDLGTPLTVRYLRTASSARPHDPRQDSIALTFRCWIDDPVSAHGEAYEFAWFPRLAHPELGCGQSAVLDAVLTGQVGLFPDS
jgi:8-oxo-dGTP pyrophosphatase MutT (NUDIX family)